MKFVRRALSPANKRQYLLSLGQRELELLEGATMAASANIPLLTEWKLDKALLNNMTKALRQASKDAHSDGYDGSKIPMAERPELNRREEANPLHAITRFEIIDHRPCRKCQGQGGVEGTECPACYGMGSKGREVIFYDHVTAVESSIQDEGRTMKLFLRLREDDEKISEEPLKKFAGLTKEQQEALLRYFEDNNG